MESKRDWGYAPEYVEAMWRMLQQDEPNDYVLGTGETHSVKEFVEEAFAYVALDWKQYVKSDPRYFRPAEVDVLIADAAKAREQLGWEPKISFRELVRIMVDADMEAAGLTPVGDGNKVLQRNFQGWHQWKNAVSQVATVSEGKALE